MAMTATATVRTTQENKKRVEYLAKATKRSSGFFYNELLTRYLDDLEDIYLGEKIREDIRSGKEKTVPAEEVFAKAGL